MGLEGAGRGWKGLGGALEGAGWGWYFNCLSVSGGRGGMRGEVGRGGGGGESSLCYIVFGIMSWGDSIFILFSFPPFFSSRCHRDRVKAVSVEPNNPHLYFSASEDGTCRQWDTRFFSSSSPSHSFPFFSSSPPSPLFFLLILFPPSPSPREQHNCSRYSSSNVLFNLRKKRGRGRGGGGGGGGGGEFKSLSVNPRRVEEVATGCSDPFVRFLFYYFYFYFYFCFFNINNFIFQNV